MCVYAGAPRKNIPCGCSKACYRSHFGDRNLDRISSETREQLFKMNCRDIGCLANVHAGQLALSPTVRQKAKLATAGDSQSAS